MIHLLLQKNGVRFLYHHFVVYYTESHENEIKSTISYI